MKLTVELLGLDPIKGEYFYLSKQESNQYSNDILINMINRTLDESAKHSSNGLEGLRPLHVELSIAIEGDGVRPAFDIDMQTLSRLSSAGASLDFDPYI
jgi:hypothetical protein